MEFRINTQISSRNCKYRIDKEFTPSCYLGTAILTGELGDFESADGVLIVANQNITKKYLACLIRLPFSKICHFMGRM